MNTSSGTQPRASSLSRCGDRHLWQGRIWATALLRRTILKNSGSPSCHLFKPWTSYQLLAVIKNLNIACPSREYPTFVEDICTPNICHVPWQYAGFDNLSSSLCTNPIQNPVECRVTGHTFWSIRELSRSLSSWSIWGSVSQNCIFAILQPQNKRENNSVIPPNILCM